MNEEKRTTLLRLRRELETQDNACTADPIFLVQRRRMISGMDTSLEVESRWMIDGHDALFTDEEALDWLDSSYISLDRAWEFLSEQPNVEEVGVIWRWEYVSAHFTRMAAEQFIEENSHRYLDELRVYVESQRRCHEWQAAIEFLLENLPRDPDTMSTCP